MQTNLARRGLVGAGQLGARRDRVRSCHGQVGQEVGLTNLSPQQNIYHPSREQRNVDVVLQQ